MTLLIIAKEQIRLFLKKPNMLLIFIAVPFFMILLFGQAFSKIFLSADIRAIDYFGTTLLTMGICQGAFIAYWGVSKDKKSNTAVRMAIAPVAKSAVVFGTFFGTWICLLALGGIVFIAAKYLLSVDYGPSIGLTILLLGTESFFSAAFGLSISVLIEDEKSSGAILNTFIPLIVFLGGGYTMIPDSGFLHDIAIISPVRWINLAMFSALKNETNNYAEMAVIICVLVSVLLLGMTALKTGRRR
jgi:ABC-2 type transport system permease protein